MKKSGIKVIESPAEIGITMKKALEEAKLKAAAKSKLIKKKIIKKKK